MRIDIDYYEILEVSPKASDEIIKKAYAILAKKYHPDIAVGMDRETATKKMAQLNEAYETLSNAELRKLYDGVRALANSSPSSTTSQSSSHTTAGSYTSPGTYRGSQSSHTTYSSTSQGYGQQSYHTNTNYEDTIKKEQQRRAEQFKRDLFYEVDLGLIFKDHVKISIDGFECGNKKIALEDIDYIKWGGLKQKFGYTDIGAVRKYWIEAGKDSGENVSVVMNKEKIFNELARRLLMGAGDRILRKILLKLKNNQETEFGKDLLDIGVHYHKTKLFGANIDRVYSWPEIFMQAWDGSLIFQNYNNDDLLSLSFFRVKNLPVLEAAVRLVQQRGLRRLTDLL